MSFRLNPVLSPIGQILPPFAENKMAWWLDAGKIGNPMAASSIPVWAVSFIAEEIGFGRSFFQRDFKLVFNTLGASGIWGQ